MATILAVDVAGYSRLMARTKRARGGAAKTTGDGLLAEFVDAVRGAVVAQRR